jgi:hypothetical protein
MNSTPILATSRRKRATFHEHYAIEWTGNFDAFNPRYACVVQPRVIPVSEPIDSLARRATILRCLIPAVLLIGQDDLRYEKLVRCPKSWELESCSEDPHNLIGTA